MKQIIVTKNKTPANYKEALIMANKISDEKMDDPMLISWYDKIRDFESPQHTSECHQGSATPGYVDHAINHQAVLKIDFDDGNFVFFYADII
ncbi:MAG: hypothetical protein DRQ51_05880 [Gammaproteobacteria bacterium]|nr:MAG: hypothetical protein DRQ51_05880 [Gammaproteobacteria bacterium]